MNRNLKVGDWVRVLPTDFTCKLGVAGSVKPILSAHFSDEGWCIGYTNRFGEKTWFHALPNELMYCHDGVKGEV